MKVPINKSEANSNEPGEYSAEGISGTREEGKSPGISEGSLHNGVILWWDERGEHEAKEGERRAKERSRRRGEEKEGEGGEKEIRRRDGEKVTPAKITEQ